MRFVEIADGFRWYCVGLTGYSLVVEVKVKYDIRTHAHTHNTRSRGIRTQYSNSETNYHYKKRNNVLETCDLTIDN